MVFNSITFLCFFAVVLAVYMLPIGWRARKLHLLVASYAFYAAWNPPFVLLLWLSTAVDWWVANRLAASREGRRGWIALSLLANLGLLGYFKYGAFALENFTAIAATLGVAYQAPAFDVVLPVGISFYTFQTLSYTIDVYRGRLAPARSFIDFAFFVTFFPQLVAGPIVRASTFLPQCAAPRLATPREIGLGVALLVAGLAEKAILADWVFAPIADAVYSAPTAVSASDAWIGTLAFAGQILADFSGYSTCAIGAALCFGYAIPHNFLFPYAALGFSDFWRRWHVSLSTWLRDYLYIPLGGNRDGTLRTYRNLLLTMLIGGLWHGASWHFVLWGAAHGTLLAGERVVRPGLASRAWAQSTGARLAGMALTFAVVLLTWVLFRARDVGEALAIYRAMFGASDANLELGRTAALFALGAIALLVGAQWALRDVGVEAVWRRMPLWLRSCALAVLIAAIVLLPGENRAFIYFQF